MAEKNELDELLDDEPTAEPEGNQGEQAEAATAEGAEPNAEADAGNRDEMGRFKAKAEGESEASQGEEGEPQEQQDALESVGGGSKEEGLQRALHESRQRERESRQEVEQMRSEFQQMRGQMQMLMQQMRPGQQQTQQQADQEVPEIWDSPDGFVDHRLQQKLDPFQRDLTETKAHFSRLFAVQQHGEDFVNEAQSALENEISAGRMNGEAVTQRLRSSVDPVGEIVRWYRDQKTRQTVGSDPEAFVQQKLEEMLSDPAQQAKILERIRGQASANPSQQQGGPKTQLPPSLNKVPGAGNAPQNLDGSDAALFEFATAK